MAPSIDYVVEETLVQNLAGPNFYDVVVVGGGSAGIGAAIGARQAAPEARILVIESMSCLGGAITHRNVLSFCGIYTLEERPRQAVGGIWDDLKKRLLAVNATPERPVRHRGVFQVIKTQLLIAQTINHSPTHRSLTPKGLK